MAQPTAIQYISARRVTQGITYTSDVILADFPLANVIIAKIDHIGETKAFVTEFVRVSINGSPMFHFEDGETCVLTSGQTFVFDKDFTIAIGKYVAI